LCSSKLGMISFFISMPLLFLYKFKEKLNGKIILAICFSMVVLFLALIKVAPQSFNRFNSLSSASLQNVDKTSSESTTVRILIWKEALVLIKNNFLFGTGVGDANDNLYNSYEQNGLTGALEHKFNAHNQFLQTFIGMGLTGFAVLLAITLGSLINAILKKHFLLFIFSLIIILNFMVESMLQTSAGVLFFAFFACFFEKVNESDLLKKESFNVPENIIKP
jgi:O-antigen ligase